MTIFIKAKLKESGKNRVPASITKHHIISKLIIQRINIPKFLMIRQLFHVKMHVQMSKIKMFEKDVRTFWSPL